MTSARRFLLPIIAIAALGLLPIPAAAQPDFEGIYIARGLDSEGHEYRRAVEIEREGDRFHVTWVEMRVVGDALVLQPTWFGVGLATEGRLSIAFVGEGSFGIVVYEGGQDGEELAGRWSVADDDGTVYSETLTRLPDELPEPATTPPLEPRGLPPVSAILRPLR